MSDPVVTYKEIAKAAKTWGLIWRGSNVDLVKLELDKAVPFSTIERGNLARIADAVEALLGEAQAIRKFLDPAEAGRRVKELEERQQRQVRMQYWNTWRDRIGCRVEAIIHSKFLAAFKGLVHDSNTRGSIDRVERHIRRTLECFRFGRDALHGNNGSLRDISEDAVRAAIAEAEAFDPLKYDYRQLGLGPQTGPRILRLVQEARKKPKGAGTEEKLGPINQRELKILNLRFGLSDNGRHTFAQIGHLLGITQVRVAQVLKRALRKLLAAADRDPQAASLLRQCKASKIKCVLLEKVTL